MQDFVIPVKPEGLLRSHEEDCYTIEEEISISSLSQKDLSGVLNGTTLLPTFEFPTYLTSTRD